MVQPPPEDDDLLIPAGNRADGRSQDNRSRTFDASPGRAGCSADKHEQCGEDLGASPHQVAGERVEPCGAAGHRIEPGGSQALRVVWQCAESGRVGPLTGQRHEHTGKEQDAGCRQHHPGVEQQGAGAAVLEQVVIDHKTKPAGNNQRADRPHDQRVSVIVGERREQTLTAEQVKARIAECRNRGKDRKKDALRTVLRHQRDHQQECAGPLRSERAAHHQPEQRTYGEFLRTDRFAREVEVSAFQPPADRHGKKAGHRHQPEAAGLDQQQNHTLSESGPMGVSIIDYQPGDTGCRGGGEQAVEQRGPAAIPAGGRQHQQESPDEDHHCKADRDDPGRKPEEEPEPRLLPSAPKRLRAGDADRERPGHGSLLTVRNRLASRIRFLSLRKVTSPSASSSRHQR